MTVGKVTCSTCGKTWADNLEYMKDTKKCGSEHCPLLSSTDEAKQRRKARVENLFKKEIHCEVSTDTVKSKIDPSKVDNCYIDVPKVIVMKLSYK